jgi:hypothetical protein
MNAVSATSNCHEISTSNVLERVMFFFAGEVISSGMHEASLHEVFTPELQRL